MKKLVRDYIPEIIPQNEKIKYRILYAQDAEYWKFLKKKLLEEAAEFVEDETEEELADIMEVIGAILKWKGWKAENIEDLQKTKRSKKGSFTKRILMEKIHS